MNKTMTKTLSLFVFSMVLAAIVAMPNQAKAEYPNILVNENMTIGSTGRGVAVLQGLLSETGYLQVPQGVALGYYGGLTKNALARYQAAQNVSPSVGYFGPLTKVAMHQDFAYHGWLSMLGW